MLTAIRKAHKPATAASIAIILDRRIDAIQAALASLSALRLVVPGRNGYRPAPQPAVTERTRVTICQDGYAAGYGWGGDLGGAAPSATSTPPC